MTGLLEGRRRRKKGPGRTSWDGGMFVSIQMQFTFKLLTYLVHGLHGLPGADTPGQCPQGVRGNEMLVAPAILPRRKSRPRRTVRSPWAFHPRAFDLRTRLCPRVFNPRGPRARNVPWAGQRHLVQKVCEQGRLICRMG